MVSSVTSAADQGASTAVQAAVGALSLSIVVTLGVISGAVDLRWLVLALALPAVLLLPRLLAQPHAVLVGVVVVFTANLAAVAAGIGLPGLAKAALLIGAVAGVRGVRRAEMHLPRSVVLLTLVCYLLAQALSLGSAEDRAAGLLDVSDLVQASLLLLVVATLASAPGGASVLAGTLVLTIASLAALSVVQEVVLQNATELGGLSNVPKGADVGGRTGRHSGPYFDANFWGRDLVLFLPLALASARAAVGRAHRLLHATGAVSVLAGVYLTQSRGAYLAVAVALLTYLVLGGPAQRRLLWLAPIALVLLASLPGVGSRLETVTQVAQAATGSGDPSLVGRVAALRLGVAMVRDRPLLGVGAGNFLAVQPEYQRRDPTFTKRSLAPHNLYLEQAAETGLIGLLAWCAFFTSVLALALNARHRRSLLPRGPASLPSPVIAGLVGWAFASLFLHMSEFHLLVMVVALVLVLHEQSRGGPALPFAPPAPGVAVRALAGATAVACFAAGCLGAASVLPVVQRPWESVGYATVAPREGRTNPYEYDVAGRGVINATYSAVLRERASLVQRSDTGPDAARIRVQEPAGSLLLSVTSRSADRGRADRATQQVLQQGSALIAATGSFYVLQVQDQDRVLRRAVLEESAVRQAVGFGLAGAPLGALVVLLAGGELRSPQLLRRRRRS